MATRLHIYFILALLYLRSVSLASVSISFHKTTGESLGDEPSILVGSGVQIKCSTPGEPIDEQRFSNIRAREALTSQPTRQFVCRLDADKTVGSVAKINENMPEPSDSECTSTIFRVSLPWTENLSQNYSCHYVTTFSNAYDEESEIKYLRTHTRPTATIEPNFSGPKPEGTEVTFKCTGTARPQPKLMFRLGGTDVTGAIHKPDENTITIDSANGTSELTWTVQLTKDMDAKTLECVTRNHPYTPAVSDQTQLRVYYGPENLTDEVLDWNLKDSNTKVLNCAVDSNPISSMNWYNGSVSEENVNGERSQKYTLYKSSFSEVTQDKQVTRIFYCKGVNSANGDKTAYRKFTIKIFTTEQPGTTPATGSSTGSEELDWWHILLIVVGAVIVIAVIIVVVVCLIKRRSSSPAAKKKAAATKKSSQSANNSAFQGSTTGQPDIIRNSYNSPTSTPANPNYQRYSHNVEDYAEAIDDKPRSRRPIALDETNVEMDPYDPAPNMETGPPGYHDSLYRNYNRMGSPQGSYSMSYGAPC